MTEAVWNPLDVHTQAGRECVFGNANRTVTNLQPQMGVTHGIAFSDLWIQTRLQERLYAEFLVVSDNVNPDVDIYLGLCSPRHGVASTFPNSAGGGAVQLRSSGGSRLVSENVEILTGLPNVQIGDRVMVAIDGANQSLNLFPSVTYYEAMEEIADPDDGTVWQEAQEAAIVHNVMPQVGVRRVWFGLNGTWFTNVGVGDPAAGLFPTWADTTPGSVCIGAVDILCAAMNVWCAVNKSGLTACFLASQQTYTPPHGFQAFDSYVKPPRVGGFDWNLHNSGAKRFPYQSNNAWRRGGEPIEGNPQWNTLTATVGHGAGKRYFECEVLGADQYTDYGINCYVGVLGAPFFEGGQGSPTNTPGKKANTYGAGREQDSLAYPSVMTVYENNVSRGTLPVEGMPKTTRMRMKLAVDFTASKIWLGVNEKWFNNGDPAAGTGWINAGPLLLATMYPAVGMKGSHVVELCLAASDMAYPIPDGFTAWAGVEQIADLPEQVLTGASTMVGNKQVLVDLISSLLGVSTLTGTGSAVADFSSSAVGASTVNALKQALASVDSSASLADVLTANGVLLADFGSTALLFNAVEVGQDEIVAWCITIEDRPGEQSVAPAYRYDNHSFQSFVEIDGELHGLAEDGIYELDGETDDGEQIQAAAHLPRQPMAADRDQRIEWLYVRGESPENMTVKVKDASGNWYEYETEFPHGDATTLRRVEIGMGLESNEWELVVENQQGAYAQVVDVLAQPIVLKRIGRST